MSRIFKTLLKSSLVVFVLFVSLSFVKYINVYAQVDGFHGATIQKSCTGPSGLAIAREGETVNCKIRVTNADDFDDALTINSITDTVHHASGDVATGNLLAAPVVLANKGDFVEKTHSYVVEVGDKDPLRDDAETQGNDPEVGDFKLSFPGLVDIIHPHTTLTKTADPTSGRAPLDVTYTYKEKNDGDSPIRNVSVTDDKCAPVVPTLGGDGIHNIGDTDNDNILDVGETWEFTCKATLNETTTNVATATGTASDRRDAPKEEAKATVKIINPHTTLTKTADPSSGSAPLDVTYTYKEKNDGNDPITDVVLTDDKCAPVKPTLGPDGIHNIGDTNKDGVLDPGETWTFTCKATLNETTTNTVVATGLASDEKPAPEERAQATVEVLEGCTLTQGFWKNHADAWPVGSLKLGSKNYSKAQLLSILKTPVKGNGLISLAHQLIAAKLNIASGASSSSIATTIASADTLINGKVVPPVGNGFLSPSSTSGLTGKLDDFNNGLNGPGHCED